MCVRTLFALLIFGLALAGCAGEATQKLAFADGGNEPYRLDSGDKLRIVVFSQETLTNSYSVDGGGNIENWSVLFDLYILLRTPLSLLKHESAY